MAFEKHLKPGEIAKLWGFSVDTVKKIFQDEPGVLRYGKPETRSKRGYFSLRIPESVFQRVSLRLRKRAA
jgi:hypothetical protein